MVFVHTAHGKGEVVDTDVLRGRKQFLVKGAGFERWLFEDQVRLAGHDDLEGNQFSYMYDPSSMPVDNAAALLTAVRTDDMHPDSHAYHEESYQDEPGYGRHYNPHIRSYEPSEHDDAQSDRVAEDDDSGYNWGPEPHYAARPGYALDGENVNEDNYADLPYDPTPQTPVEQFNQESTIGYVPGDRIDPKKRVRKPTNSLDFSKGKDRPYPGPNPDLFAKHAGWQHDPERGHEFGRGEGGYNQGMEGDDSDREYDDEGYPVAHDPWGGRHVGAYSREDEDAHGVYGDEARHHFDNYGSPDLEDATNRRGELRPAGLGSKYAHLIPAVVDHYNDPAQRFRDNPVREINRIGYMTTASSPEMEAYGRLVEADAQIREAAWRDVAAKAKRIRKDGGVDVEDIDYDRIHAKVAGDHGTYDVMIAKSGMTGGQSVSNWRCSCDWGRWAFKRQFTFVGRLCSHAYAAYQEMQSRHIKQDPEHPFNVRNRQSLTASYRTADVVSEYKSYLDDTGQGADVDTLQQFLTQPDDDTDNPKYDEEDAHKLYDYLDGQDGKNDRDERDYDTPYGGEDWEDKALRNKPGPLVPSFHWVDNSDDHAWSDVTDDDRKTTGPDQIMRGAKVDPLWHGHAREDDDEAEPIVHFSSWIYSDNMAPDAGMDTGMGSPGAAPAGLDPSVGDPLAGTSADMSTPGMMTARRQRFLAAISRTADEQLLDKLRDLSQADPAYGDLEEQNNDKRDVIDELRDRGYDASQLVASLRREGTGSFYGEGGGDWANKPFQGSGPTDDLASDTSARARRKDLDDMEDVADNPGHDVTTYQTTKPRQSNRTAASWIYADDLGIGQGPPGWGDTPMGDSSDPTNGAMDPVSDFVNDASNAKDAWGAGKGLWNKVKGLGRGVADEAGKVADEAGKFGGEVADEAGKVGGEVADGVGSAGNAIVDGAESIGPEIASGVESAAPYVADALPAVLGSRGIQTHSAHRSPIVERSAGRREQYIPPEDFGYDGGGMQLEASYDDTDVVAQFQRIAQQGGSAITAANTGGSGGGVYSDGDIAGVAQRLLKTAGRKFTPQEEFELETERHVQGARNLPTAEDLAGTHYLMNM